MNVITASKRPIARIAAAALLISAGGALALSAIMAQTPRPTEAGRGKCKDWPLEQDRELVKKVFTKALQNSATDERLRNRLLDHANAKGTIQGLLWEADLEKHLTFPDEAIVLFFEPDVPVTKLETKATEKMAAKGENHCFHIFELPERGDTKTADFETNLRCCYKPWTPTAKDGMVKP